MGVGIRAQARVYSRPPQLLCLNIGLKESSAGDAISNR